MRRATSVFPRRGLSLSFGPAIMLSLAIALLACEGPQGPSGSKGDKGDQGDQGEPGAPGGLDPSLTALDKAFIGVGGKEAVMGLNGVIIESKGNRLILGEGPGADDSARDVSLFELTATFDFSNDALRLDYKRDLFGLFPASVEVSEIIKGNLGYIDGIENVIANPPPPEVIPMPSDRWAAVRKQQSLLNPHILLRAVAGDESMAKLAGVQLVNGVVHEVIEVTDSVFPITLLVNPANGLITKLTTVENDHLRRDVILEVFYHDWRNEGGVYFPYEVLLTLDGELIHAETRVSVETNPDIPTTQFDFPTGPDPEFVEADAERGAKSHQFLHQFASIGIPQEGLQIQIDDAELEPEVYHLTGGSHHSLVIEQEQGIVVVEAPLYPERSEAIIAKIAELIPGKDITHVIATHHHTDHSAGLRAFVASGAKVVLGAKSRDFFANTVFRAPSTVVPDTLANAPKAADIITVAPGETLTLADTSGARDVEVRTVPTNHANDMLMVFVPAAGVLFNSDLFSPGQQAPSPGAVELRDAVNSQITDAATVVTKIAGGHGVGTQSFQELDTLVTPTR